MKTIKLIVLCLSLFLVSHSTFAQLSEKQIKYNKTLTEYNDSIQKHKERVQILNDIDKRIKSSTLSEAKKNDLIAQRDIRYKKIKTLEQNIQKLDNTLKTLERQIQIEENAKRLLQEQMQMTKEELDAERQKIEELTRRYWAKQLSWHDYVDQIFGNRSQISFNGKKYAVGLWEKKANEKLHKINQCNDEMQIIRYDLIDEVYKMTNFVYKPNITPNNIKTIPNDPYYFSNKINEKVQSQKKPPLQQNTLQNIQQTFNNAAAEHAKVNSEKEKAKKEYDELQKALDSLNDLCQGCKQ